MGAPPIPDDDAPAPLPVAPPSAPPALPNADDLADASWPGLRYPYVPGQQPPYLLEIPGAWPFSTVVRVLAQRTDKEGRTEITDMLLQYTNVYTGPKPDGWPGL